MEIEIDATETGDLLRLLDEWDVVCQRTDKDQLGKCREVTRGVRNRLGVSQSNPTNPAMDGVAISILARDPAGPRPAAPRFPGMSAPPSKRGINVLTLQGIGDSVWTLPKLGALAERFGAKAVHLKLAVSNANPVETRALEFLRRFSAVASAECYVMPHVRGAHAPMLKVGPQADKDGLYRYIDDGVHSDLPGIDYVLIPNAALERGIRLEDWQPDLKTDWKVLTPPGFTETALQIGDREYERGEFAVFFMSSLDGNWTAGHNMGAMWTPDEWVDLGERLHEELGLRIVVVGAPWDASYYEKMIAPAVSGLTHWSSQIGRFTVWETLALIQRSRLMVSYQSGLGVMAHYLGVPTAMWWRPKGKSISPHAYVSPEESMATAWTYPDWKKTGKYMPLIYGRESVDDIAKEIVRREW